jgi:hypothetical protein
MELGAALPFDARILAAVAVVAAAESPGHLVSTELDDWDYTVAGLTG